MAREFRLPDIGEGLTEAEIVRWVIPVGGTVAADETVVEVETDKAVVEIPSPFAGVVLHHGAAEGEVVEVGEILVVVGTEGETWPDPSRGEAAIKSEDRPATADTEATAQPGGAEPEPEDAAPVDAEPQPEAAGESVPEEESDHGEVAPIVGTLSEDAEELPSRSEQITDIVTHVKALPLVRKLAKDLGVDLGSIQGTGPDGRITREDVIAAAESSQGGPVELPAAPTLPPVPSLPSEPRSTVPAGARPAEERRPLSKLRRTIAANMARSWSEIPHVTTFDEVDASRLLAMRERLGRRHDTKIPLESLIVKAVSPVLREFPEFNATLDGDELVLHGRQDIGIAVDTPDGLLVGVIRNADRHSVLALAQEVSRLGTAAKERKLAPDELTGQTFTVSNIGAVGGGYGTPIVPAGTVAILSVGRALDRPVAHGGRVDIAPLLPLSLSYDHRVIDGGLGRRFMSMLLENLEEPGLFLAD
ncbi:MAG TPA: dihydrolipoamide acetyltransferase family protein [Acidimicrobiia bacterium]|nr:dihydrolipoamide acetyltransferase family protein [Acidimicrobiia bacterium]